MPTLSAITRSLNFLSHGYARTHRRRFSSGIGTAVGRSPSKAKEKSSVVPTKKNPNLAVITVGKDDFELSIPLVKNKGKWSFDTKVGREEILNRRIGTNELDAIAICRGFVEAQHEYAEEIHI